MRSSPKLLCCLFVTALWTGAPTLRAKDSATPDPKGADKGKSDKKKDAKKKDKKDDKKPEDTRKMDGTPPPADGTDPNASTGGKLSLPLVKDHPAQGLKIPYYDTQGNLQMIYTIGTALRVDNDNVKMKDVTVETYNTEGEPDMTVELPVSQLNLNTKVVTSDTKTTITRSDMVVTGDSVQFNTVTKEARLVGHVHVILYDAQDDKSTAPKPESSEPSQPTETPAKPNE